MKNLYKIIATVVFQCLFLAQQAIAQGPTQSIIYDAATIMNATHGLNALLVPQAAGWDIENPLTATKEGNAVTTTPISYLNPANSEAVILQVLIRNAGLASTATRADIIAAYAGNPFLNSLLPPAAPFTTTSAPAAVNILTVGNYVAARSSGGMGHDLLGNLVNGTADFLIKRAQEEISISVFAKLKKFIVRYPELDTLFPRTCALIKPVEAYEYNKALDAFKAAIKEDLSEFISNVPSLYHISRYQQLNKRTPSLTLLFAACSLFNDLHGENGLAHSMYNLGQQIYLSENNNYAAFIKIITTISNSLQNKTLSDPESKYREYIHVEFVQQVTHGDPTLKMELGKFYLGLLWQHIQSIQINVGGANRTFASLLIPNNTATGLRRSIETVNVVFATIQKLDSALGAIKGEEQNNVQYTGNMEMKAKRFVIYGDIVSAMLNFTALFTDPANTNYADRVREIARYLPQFTNGVTNLIKDFYTNEYSLGISELEKLFQAASDFLKASEDNKVMKAQLISDLNTSLSVEKGRLDADILALDARITTLQSTPTPTDQIRIDIQAEIQELKTAKQQLQSSLGAVNYQIDNKKTVIFNLSKVIEYLHLFASITKAENSKAVEALLETYAMPAGSSRIKKVSSVNIAVNAYVGGFGGRSKDMGDGFTNTYGLTAPIGITFSKGWEKFGSASIFLSAFDIGGTIRYKLDNQGKYQQDVTLAGIVSPGIHAIYGFPFYLPVSFGLGCQWISPSTANTNNIDLKGTFNAFLAVDIPMFNLLARKKK
jgi:hypothetical protein